MCTKFGKLRDTQLPETSLKFGKLRVVQLPETSTKFGKLVVMVFTKFGKLVDTHLPETSFKFGKLQEMVSLTSLESCHCTIYQKLLSSLEPRENSPELKSNKVLYKGTFYQM